MDIFDIAPIEKELNVKHPATGEPIGLILVLACSHDDRVKAGVREANDVFLKAKDNTSKEAKEDYESALAAAYVVDIRWQGDATWKGKTPEYSRDLAKSICAKPSISEQVAKEVRKIGDFYKA